MGRTFRVAIVLWRPVHHPDGQCAGQQYIELYDFDPIPANTNYLTHILNNVTYWVSNNIGLTAWSYVDAIHMSMPAYAKLAALNSKPRSPSTTNAAYPGRNVTWFHQIKSVFGASNGLYNTTDHLWWRDTTFLSNYVASDGTAKMLLVAGQRLGLGRPLPGPWMSCPPVTRTSASTCKPFRTCRQPSRPCSVRMVSGT